MTIEKTKSLLGFGVTFVAALACSEDPDTSNDDAELQSPTPTQSTSESSSSAPTSASSLPDAPSSPSNGGSSGPTAPAPLPSNTSPTPSNPTPTSTPSPSTPSGSGGSDGAPNATNGQDDTPGGAAGTSPEPQPSGLGGADGDEPPTQPGTPSGDAEKPSSGCGSTTSLESGRHTIDVGGTAREYILKLPDDYDSSQPYRFVFGLHPLGGSAQQVAGAGLGGGGYYGLDSQADGTAIFVAPEGLPYSGNNLGWENTNGRDLALLNAILDHLGSELCIDENRVFSTGFSFGGMMSFAAACGMEGRIRAIAPMAGNIQVSGCVSGDAPVAVLGFHGDDDQVVSISGGRAGRDVFIERNGCDAETQAATLDWCDGIGNDNQPCSCVSYQGCDEGYPVIWCEFNGSHTPAPSSAETIWNFFSQF